MFLETRRCSGLVPEPADSPELILAEGFGSLQLAGFLALSHRDRTSPDSVIGGPRDSKWAENA
jgi:hypothetical protein